MAWSKTGNCGESGCVTKACLSSASLKYFIQGCALRIRGSVSAFLSGRNWPMGKAQVTRESTETMCLAKVMAALTFLARAGSRKRLAPAIMLILRVETPGAESRVEETAQCSFLLVVAVNSNGNHSPSMEKAVLP